MANLSKNESYTLTLSRDELFAIQEAILFADYPYVRPQEQIEAGNDIFRVTTNALES